MKTLKQQNIKRFLNESNELWEEICQTGILDQCVEVDVMESNEVITYLWDNAELQKKN